MNVLQFVDSYLPIIDGVVQAVYQYVTHINKSHGRCWVVAPSVPDAAKDGPEVIRCWSLSSPMVRKPYRIGIPSLDPLTRQALLDLPVDIDIVHAHSPFGCGVAGLRYARENGIPLVATFHTKYRDDFAQALKSPSLVERAVKQVVWFYQRADEVWSVNEATAETLHSYGYKGEIKIMPNGCDMQLPENPQAVRAEARKSLGLPDDAAALLFVGQHIWQKNLRLILEGTALLVKRGVNVRLICVGSGSDEQEIRALAEKLGLAEKVRFMGLVREREALRGLYMAADLFTFPSLYDNAPIVVNEAAALGLPSLLISGSNAARRINGNENGFLCENDTNSFADAVQRALLSTDTLRRVGATARNTLPRQWTGVVREAVDHYARVIDKYQRMTPQERLSLRELLGKH